MDYLSLCEQAAQHVREQAPQGFTPRVGLTLGTGLGGLAANIQSVARIPYGEIPNFPVSTVQSHAGELILGHLAGVPVAALAGRFHLYEGYSPREATLPVRVLGMLGLEAFIFCNAAGGLVPSWRAGRVMLINDHINFTGRNPLVGDNVDAWGERFPDMSQVYDPGLRQKALEAARDLGVELYQGVYVGVLGPSMETPAETAMLKVLGAQAVGMSTVLEVIAARHMGLKVLGFSAIANINIPEAMEPAPLELVIANAEAAGHDLSRVIQGVLGRW